MSLDLRSIITQSRKELNEPDSDNSHWTDTELAEYADFEHRHLLNKITGLSEGYSIVKSQISTVAGTERYDMPSNTKAIIDIWDNSEDPEHRLYYIPFHKLHTYLDDNANIYGDAIKRWSFIKSQIWRLPTPATAASNNIDVYHIRHAPVLHWQTASAGTSTSITLAEPTSSAGAGHLITKDDYYNHATIEIIEATGIGQAKVISDYVASTKIATVPAWSPTPGASSIYSIMPEIPLDWEELLVLGTVIRAKIGDEMSDPGKHSDFYRYMLKECLDGSEDRQRQHSRVINYIEDPYYD